MSDEQLQAVLGRFAALADALLREPADWLGDDDPEPEQVPQHQDGRSDGVGRRVLAGLGAAAGGARRVIAGREHPGSPGWAALPVGRRSSWWVARIQAVAAPIAATPRIAGALADRVPLQGALGAAAAGLTVCAVAREHGVAAPYDWVPLLGTVLFDRDLPRPAALPTAAEAASTADAAEPVVTATTPGPAGSLQRATDAGAPPEAVAGGRLRRAGRGVWRLALLLWGLPGLFDERPRGALLWRALGKLPVVGLPAGVLDERGAVRAAADETARLLRSRPASPA